MNDLTRRLRRLEREQEQPPQICFVEVHSTEPPGTAKARIEEQRRAGLIGPDDIVFVLDEIDAAV